MILIPDTTLRLFLLGDGSGAIRTFEETAVAAEGSADKIEKAGTRAGTRFGDAMDRGTTRAGNSLSKLSSFAGNWGIPTGGIDKFGEHLAAADTKGKKFATTMSEVGKATLVGGAAAFIATGVEAVHLADKFDIAQASLQTAMANSGQNFDAWKGKIAAASHTTGALVSGNASDVDQALATLVTATGSASKAMANLNLVENIAAYRHISLEEAAAGVAKVYGGNTRILAQWGLQIDAGSAKLHSIQSAEMAVQKDTLALNAIQAEVNSGQEKGVKGAAMLAQAHLTLRNAELNLQQSQQAIPHILDLLNAKTQNAAATLGQTLPGQIHIAEHGLENLGIKFGEWLVPKIITTEHALSDVIGWFQRNKAAADALGVVIGGTLAAAVGVFTFNKLTALVSGVQNVVQWFGRLGQANTEAAASFAEVSTAAETDAAATSGAVASMASSVATSDASIVASNQAAASSFLSLSSAAGKFGAFLAGGGAAGIAAYAVLKGGVASNPYGHNPTVSAINNWIAAHPGSDVGQAVAALGNGTVYGSGSMMGPVQGGLTLGAGRFGAQGAYSGYSQDIAATGGSSISVYQPPSNPLAGTHIPGLGGIPALGGGGGGGGSSSSRRGRSGRAGAGPLSPGEVALEDQAHALLAEMHLASTGPTSGSGQLSTVKSLETSLNAVHDKALRSMIDRLTATHDERLIRLAAQLAQVHASSLAKLTSIIDTDIQQGQNKIATLQGAILNASLPALRRDLSGVHMQEMQQLVKELKATHSTAAAQEAQAIEATIAQAQADLKTIIATHYAIALADQTQMVATETADMSRLFNDMAAQIAQGIADTSKVYQDAAGSQATAVSDQGQIVADILQERGKYGLDLLAQQNKVTLDKMTASWDTTIGKAQEKVDQASLNANKRVAAAQERLDNTTAAQDKAIQQAQNQVDRAQFGTQLQQQEAAANLKRVEAQAALAEARQQAIVDHAKNVGATITAQANAALAQAEARAKVAEAREQALIQKEEAQAQTQFAGTGFTVNIFTESNDPLAHGIAAGWALRRQVGPT